MIPAATPSGTCAVIGAGLAGASVAAALARRGWAVTVLDGASGPASGASGLPVGLLTPHTSTDDCKLSRLSRAGIRMTLTEAKRHLVDGQDWALSGSMEYLINGRPGLPENWPDEGADWSQAVSTTQTDAAASLWHAKSAWIKPGQLVRAWLSLPNITFKPNALAVTLTWSDGRWSVLGKGGQILAAADRVVFANAAGALPLLQKVQANMPDQSLELSHLPQQHEVRGQLSFGRHDSASHTTFPPHPINGAGSVISNIPTEQGLTWYIGSSFQPATQPAHSQEQNHQFNFDRLEVLNPEMARQLKPQFESFDLSQWSNSRCVTSDRLPMVGELGHSGDGSLWLCAGMGSRGLSFSVLCAELLAAQWGAEPLPIEFNLAQSFTALRSSPSS